MCIIFYGESKDANVLEQIDWRKELSNQLAYKISTESLGLSEDLHTNWRGLAALSILNILTQNFFNLKGW